MIKIKNLLTVGFAIDLLNTFSQIGSGALPVENIPTVSLSITSASQSDTELRDLAHALRQLPKPVVGRLHNGKLLLDLRCLDTELTVETEFIDQLSLLQESKP